MSEKTRLLAQALNRMVTEKDFGHAPDDYIYASLSKPPIKVIKKKGDDEFDWDVECPNCHKVVNYGEHIFMEAGDIYCDSDGCYDAFKEAGKGN